MVFRHKVSRRRLAQGGAAALAAGLLVPAGKAVATGERSRAATRQDNGGSESTAPARAGREPAAQAEQVCDLTRRWLDVKPTLTKDGLVGAWPFDEGSGYWFDDVMGKGAALYITGSTWNTTDSGLTSAFRRAGRRAGGVHLNGTQWLWAEHRRHMSTGSALTITAWVRPDNPPSDQAMVLTHGTDYQLRMNGAGLARLAVRTRGGGTHSVATKAGAIATGVWTHIAATMDADAGRLAIYLNGVEDNSVDVGRFNPAASEKHLVAGNGLVGSLDELTLHNVALDAADVRGLYLVGLPKLYAQSRETIDVDRQVWTRFKGSSPIPHPVGDGSVFTARFDGSTTSEQGAEPVDGAGVDFVPSTFGAAADVRRTNLVYASPLTGSDGTLEAWVLPANDDSDPDRTHRKVVFRATGQNTTLTLATQNKRWQAELSGGPTLRGPEQTFVAGEPEHVAVAWGKHASGDRAVSLYVNGVRVASEAVGTNTTFDDQIRLGGTNDAPAYVLVDDVSIANQVREWGEVCPRGHSTTKSNGLDLRDGFDRPDGTAPVLWSASSGTWTYRTRDWEDPRATGEDPHRFRSLFQSAADGPHAVFHPDAYGRPSSIEAGVSFPESANGWAGVFVHSPGPGDAFTGYTFAINPANGNLRLASYVNGAVANAKTLPYGFPTAAHTTYELTLTSANDGVLRGFVDGSNMISMRIGSTAREEGHAGLFTDGIAACFDDLHVTALTPAAANSRLVQSRVFATGPTGYQVDHETAVLPFRWHKRRGKPPAQYRDGGVKPEQPGNIAGARTSNGQPTTPIPPAYWRSEDSANPDPIVVDGKVHLFLRGNHEVDGQSASSHIGVLGSTTRSYDGIHFDDPNLEYDNLEQCELLQGQPDDDVAPPHTRYRVNDQGSAYIGGQRVLVLVKHSGSGGSRLAFDYYNVATEKWKHGEAQGVPFSQIDPDTGQLVGLLATPELVSFRDPDTDRYGVLLYHRTDIHDPNAPARPFVALGITGLRISEGDVPIRDRSRPMVRSISRRKYKKKAIYNFRVLFDNGIYYLHYSEGDQVPDWPNHFVLAATLDPYNGPWIVNPETDDKYENPEKPNQPSHRSDYFRRGGAEEPDNGAIWQGAMFKHRGRYYMYYENFHCIVDRNAEYDGKGNYSLEQNGSRLGYATGT